MPSYIKPDGTAGYHNADPQMWAKSQAGAAAHHQAALRSRQLRQGMNAAAGPQGVKLPGGMTYNNQTGAILGQPGQFIQDLYPSSAMPSRPVGYGFADQLGKRDWDYLWGQGDFRPDWAQGTGNAPRFQYGAYGYHAPDNWAKRYQFDPVPGGGQGQLPPGFSLGGY